MLVNELVQTALSTSIENITTIARLVDQFIEHGYKVDMLSTCTMRTRATHLHQFAHFCEETNVTDARQLSIMTINDFLMRCSETHNASTVNTTKRIIKVFIRWLEECKELQIPVKYEAIRTKRLKSKVPRAIPHNDIMKVINSIECPIDRLAMRTMYEAGLRIDEATKVTYADVKDGAILIHGKGSVERTVYVSKALSDMLKSLYTASPNAGGYVFQYKGRKLTTGTLRLRINRYSERVLGHKIDPHQLRHSFAIRLLENGCDIVTIQTLMGHESVETTRGYLRALDTFVENQYRKYRFID